MSRRPQVSGLADQSHLTRLTGLPLSPALLFYCSPALVGLRPTRGDWQNFKREVQPYAAVFLHGTQPHILRIRSIMAEVA